MRLPDSERYVMDILWDNGPTHAKDIAAILCERANWNKTTTYTMLTRCMAKGYLTRSEPKFLCTPILTKEEVSLTETDNLINHNYNGSADLLVASLVERKKLSLPEMERLCDLLRQMEQDDE